MSLCFIFCFSLQLTHTHTHTLALMPDRIVRPSRWETQTTNLRLCLITDSGWRFLLYNMLTYAVRTRPSWTAWSDPLPLHSACIYRQQQQQQPEWWHLTSMDSVVRRWEDGVHAGNSHNGNASPCFSAAVAKSRTMLHLRQASTRLWCFGAPKIETSGDTADPSLKTHRLCFGRHRNRCTPPDWAQSAMTRHAPIMWPFTGRKEPQDWLVLDTRCTYSYKI